MTYEHQSGIGRSTQEMDDERPLAIYVDNTLVGTFRNPGDLYAYLTEYDLAVDAVMIIPTLPPLKQPPD